MNRINVIIPTTCELRRKDALRRAISSVLTQGGVDAEIIVVVNGTRYDPASYLELQSWPGLKVVYQEKGDLPLALRLGRSLVTAPFFSFLDDDDEYLPNALQERLRPLLEECSVDYVASNGFYSVDGQDEIAVTHVGAVQRDPMRALLKENWLASCGGLFRSSRISIDYFDGRTHYLEWTVLGYKLTSSMKMVFVDVPTYRVNESQVSLSKSEAFKLAEIGVLGEILTFDLPGDVKDALRVKLGRAHHSLSSYFLRQGDLKRAWRYHLASFRYPDGYRYLTYSRHLLPFLSRG